jgi:hypothetical protein
VQHQWFADIVHSYEFDAEAKELITKLSVALDSCPPFTLSRGVLRHKNRIWLGSSKPLQQQVLREFHSSPVGGHSGALVTYQRIKHLFYWPGLKVAVWSFIQLCTVCLQAKPERVRYPGLLQPLPVPAHSWEVVNVFATRGSYNRFQCQLILGKLSQ